jgi:hypothetical protein
VTLEEYEQIIGNALVVAHNNKDMGALMTVFSKADQTLENSNISPADRKDFWEKVRRGVINSPRLLQEKQANSALIALIQAIEKEIAARTSKSTGKSK